MFGLFKKKEEVLESINGITLSLDDIIRFGDTIGDHAPIHRSLEIAQKFDFDDIPVIGVHLASIGERITRNLVSVMQDPTKPLNYATHSVTFRYPVYQGERIDWKIDNEAVSSDSRRYVLIIESRDPTKKPRVELLSKFSSAQPVFNPQDLGEAVLPKILK